MDWSEPRTTVLVGRKHSGKTNALRYIIHLNTIKQKRYKFGVVFTNTKFDDEYTFMPEGYIIQGWDVDVFNEYLDQLLKAKEDSKDEKIPCNFIIFDDLVSVLTDSSEFNNFICNHRHYNTHVFLCAQYLKRGVTTTLREYS